MGMRANKLEPDEITFGTLLDVCTAGYHANTHEVVNMLAGDHNEMDAATCTLFIKGFVRANCISKALQLYDVVKKRTGKISDIVTYSILIKACVDVHDLEKALQLLSDLREGGHAPDDI